jgi:hypothetical protein
MKQTAEALQGEPYYYVFAVTDKVLDRMVGLIDAMPSQVYRNIIRRALRYWTIDLTMKNGTILSNGLARDGRLCLENEDQGLSLDEQNQLMNADLMYLMAAQQEERKRFSSRTD